ncbi:hypothetical protein JCGZ_03995 [Jatropha curcas]|uniref:glycerophosphodiester phosphodiesterase n=1 Tax=Jatropha curcas TaxID=180498 RepID=A0A067KR75_JATCU|nr:glycerophosphodiester phosphodiesterase GDPDL7 isoform X2 [Jatropha curcas]KDP38642.1 hypothetical protein JCGZ_03995 [Jatropha curcas]
MVMRCLLLMIFLLMHTGTIIAQGLKPPAVKKKWLTLDGKPPRVIARGGLSGVFPESSNFATDAAKELPDVIILCTVQMTKDRKGICQPDVTLENSTNIDMVYPNGSKTYKVNGKDVEGWFSIDYTSLELSNVTLMQNIFRRPSSFDEMVPLSTLEDLLSSKIPSVWLNVRYDMFFTEHKLNVAPLLQKLPNISYISSPEIGFLKKMNGKGKKAKTKLIFVFLGKEAVEPTTNQTYGSILENLATIKEFASGIVVPKNYIWPVRKDNYLEANPTSLVLDAHKQGLEVYANGFANDYAKIYNYSYDPGLEYLSFINNSEFSVDGVISDFPNTASSAVGCFGQYGGFSLPREDSTVTIITHNGASGVYAGCTDRAYEQALKDGADIIDCTVQLSSDGTAFCMDSADVSVETNAMSNFMSRSSTVPEIKESAGIFTFDLTWAEIQTLQPRLSSPYGNDNLLPRNPAYKTAGKFLKLAEFLEFAKAKAPTGILINIENAPYLASKKGLDIVSAVSSALEKASFDKQSTQKVLIQSDDTSVLSKFKKIKAYQRVLHLKEEISDAPKKSVAEIKKFADVVNLPRFSIIPTDGQFAMYITKVIDEMHAANLTVYVSVLRNEFLNLAFDYFSDPIIEIATYNYLSVDGIITEFPATAYRYFTNLCSNPEYDYPYIIAPIQPPMLRLLLISDAKVLPPAPSPRPVLAADDVVDPPLPAVTKVTNSSSSTPAPKADKPEDTSSAALPNIADMGFSLLAVLCSYFLGDIIHQ